MKREDILDSLEFLDEELIREADQTRIAEETAGSTGIERRRKRPPVHALRWGTLAAGFTVLVISLAVLAGIRRTANESPVSMQSIESTEAAAAGDSRADQFGQDGMNGIEENGIEEMEIAEMPSEAAGEDEDAVEGYAFEENTADGYISEENTANGYAAEKNAAEDYAPEEETSALLPTSEPAANAAPAGESMQIRITSDAGEVVFVLNDTPAAKSLAAQLPLRAETEPYGNNEIIFHPEEPLDTADGMTGGGTAGYLGYFEPWNNVVMYYGDFDEYPGLYILGEAVSGAEIIKDIRGGITVEVKGNGPSDS